MPKNKKGKKHQNLEELTRKCDELEEAVDSLNRKVKLGYGGGIIAIFAIAGAFFNDLTNAIEAITGLIDALARLYECVGRMPPQG